MSQIIDAYIEDSQEFAKPVLNYIRYQVHRICPVSEEIKWNFPSFLYKGKILCFMASFKDHCAFGFWLADSMSDPHNLFIKSGENKAMGQFGKLTSINQLPASEVFEAYLREAVTLQESGVKLKRTVTGDKKNLILSEEFAQALEQSAEAKNFFNRLSYSNQKEYVEWIDEAKTEMTKFKRISTSIEWLTEGKDRNWKYKK